MTSNQTGELFQGVTDFFSQMKRMNDVMYGRKSRHVSRSGETAWTPLTDIHADGDDLVTLCEAPGVALADIDVSFANGSLSISGRRETANAKYKVHERFHGAFHRVLGLPEGVGDDDIRADLCYGLLVVIVAGGAAASKSKRIQVNEGPETG